MIFRTLARRLVPAFFALALLAPQGQAQTAVDLELQLLVDVSGSVDASEFALQVGGYVNAFNNAALWAAIEQGTIGAIAVNFIYWSSLNQQSESVGWTLIDSFAASQAFATAINGTSRPFSGLTAPGSAINFALPLFASNAFDGTREVIDVSGDGSQNDGATTSTARDAAAAAGVTINGISIGGEFGLAAWYQNNVITAGGFHLHAAAFADFEGAILTKLEAEIIGGDPSVVPEPATMVLLATGLIGMGAVQFRRRRRKA